MKMKDRPDYQTGLSRCKKNRCPACDSTQVEGQEVDVMPGECTQHMICLECDTEWQEHYTMTSFAYYETEEEV